MDDDDQLWTHLMTTETSQRWESLSHVNAISLNAYSMNPAVWLSLVRRAKRDYLIKMPFH